MWRKLICQLAGVANMAAKDWKRNCWTDVLGERKADTRRQLAVMTTRVVMRRNGRVGWNESGGKSRAAKTR
ncbi:hypothetical protein Scep_007387 [Stephania cephalantha]|uniref:Uncharacterized protein n=1 Tax=Stephania cephalantha TaxID=152367 RepID=A0AAP0PNS7_9MAGN